MAKMSTGPSLRESINLDIENRDIEADQFQADLPTSYDSSESQPLSDEHVASSSGDFGKVIELKRKRKLTDHEKYFHLAIIILNLV